MLIGRVFYPPAHILVREEKFYASFQVLEAVSRKRVLKVESRIDCCDCLMSNGGIGKIFYHLQYLVLMPALQLC